MGALVVVLLLGFGVFRGVGALLSGGDDGVADADGTQTPEPAGDAGVETIGSSIVVDATDDSFDTAIDTKRLVLIDLWAAWCGPCRMITPILERLSVEFAGRLKVVKVDVDANPLIAQRFDARSIPLLKFVRDSEVIDTVVGAQSEHVFRTLITQHLR